MKNKTLRLLALVVVVLWGNGVWAANIKFADQNVKDICVSLWDTDKDGELSEEEAAKVTDIGQTFSYKSINSFDELRYFSGLKYIGPYAFNDCGSLQSVCLPNSVAGVYDGAFADCISLKSINIPDGVTYIGKSAFSNCNSLQSVCLPDCVTTVADYTFCNCISLTSINIPNSVTSIGEFVFSGCTSLASINIPNSVTSFGECAFAGCTSLTSINIPNSVTFIGKSAFKDCTSLTAIRIPESVVEIGNSAFENCNGMTSVVVEWFTPLSIDESVFANVKTKNCHLQVPSGRFKVYKEKDVWKEFKLLGDIILFADEYIREICLRNWDFDQDGVFCEFEADSVTDLGTAFQSSQNIYYFDELKYFTGLKSLNATFINCHKLKSVTIPANVEKIEVNTFYNCSNLKDLTVGWSTPLKIDVNVFRGWTKKLNNCTLHIPVGTLAAYKNAAVWKNFNVQPANIVFADPVAKQICIENWDSDNDGELSEAEAIAVTDLGLVFRNSGITSFDELRYFTGLPGVESFAFCDCASLESIILPESIRSIGNAAFNGCNSLQRASVPNGVTSIGVMAFSGCSSLQSVNIPEGVTEIASQVFYGCASLKCVNIPEGVERIGDYAFANCNGLTDVTVHWTTPLDIESDVFSGMDLKKCFLHIPYGCFTEYKSSNVWREFYQKPANIVFADSVAKQICVELWDTDNDGELSEAETLAVTDLVNAFNSKSDITSFDELQYFINLKNIGREAFCGCSSLRSITLPEGVTSIDDNAFQQCFALVSISIPDGVTNIGDNAFRMCSSLSSVSIPNSVTNIGNEAFRACTALSSLTIPEGVKNIGTGCFYGCSALQSVIIPNGVADIGNYVFYMCSSLSSVSIHNNVTRIEDNAFSGCAALQSVTIPEGVRNIGACAFQGCSGLQSVLIPRSVVGIGTGSFADCTGLKDIKVKWTDPLKIDANVFEGVKAGNCRLHVLRGTETAYKSADVWKNFICVVDNTILFVDSRVERICVENWDTDKDGEFSYAEAEAVKNLGTTFKGTDITSFEELKYFTGLTSIESNAFAECTFLKETVLPEGVASIGEKAFSGCTSLETLTISKSVTSIGNYAFSGCSKLVKVTVGWITPIKIKSNVFDGVVLGNCTLHIPFRVLDAYRTADVWNKFKITTPVIVFADPEVKRLCIQNWDTDKDGELSEEEAMAVTDLGTVFSDPLLYHFPITSFDELQYFTGLKSIRIYAFVKCEYLKSVIIPNNVNEIEPCSFQGCEALSSITFPKSLQNINYKAFDGCKSLQTVNIPKSVNSIGDYAFRDCTGLKTVTVEWTTPLKIDSSVFVGVTLGNCWLRVPRGNDNKYKTQSVWKDFRMDTEIVFADQKVKEICFQNWDADKDGTLWQSEAMAVTDLGTVFRETAITSFDELKYFTGLQSIASNAFRECESLRSISLPESLNTIGDEAFRECTLLQSINIPYGVRNIARLLFRNCKSLQSINLPSSVTTISNSAFWGCESLQSIDIPSSVTEIAANTFHRCFSLQSIIIPPKLTTIANSTFNGCISLQSVFIPENVKEIKSMAFADCKALKDVTIEWKTPLNIDQTVFSGVTLENCTLHVPEYWDDLYRSANVWKDFKIVTYNKPKTEPDSIDETENITQAFSGEEDIYDLTGRKVTAPQRGKVYIIRTKSGKIVKRMY